MVSWLDAFQICTCFSLIHKNFQEPKKEFQGTVCEIIGGEALMLKLSNSSEVKKIFLSSIRSPKETPKYVNLSTLFGTSNTSSFSDFGFFFLSSLYPEKTKETRIIRKISEVHRGQFSTCPGYSKPANTSERNWLVNVWTWSKITFKERGIICRRGRAVQSWLDKRKLRSYCM